MMNASFNQIVIASHNAGKVGEIAELLSPLGILVQSAAELQLDEPEETGGTFTENALIKSQAAMQVAHIPALADDSGLVVPALGGAPGIYSARWGGPEKDFGLAMRKVEDECKKVEVVEPEAYFICVLALSRPELPDVVFEGRVHGKLVFPPKGDKGFGYDPIFVPKGYDQSFAEISSAEKQKISHRSDAFNQLMQWLERGESYIYKKDAG